MSLGAVLTNLWRMRRAQRDLPPVTHALPARADIEPTTFCNFRCPHCPTSAARQEQPAPARAHLTAAGFQVVLDQLPTLYRVKLVGLGEPLLNPDFFAMVREARRRRLRVLTTTNGSLLDRDRRSELLACGLSHVNISVDAADPKTHARLRPGSDLERIGEGIAALIRERGGRKWPQIRVWHVLQQTSTPELPDLVSLCVRWGVDGLLGTAKLTNFGFRSLEEVVAQRRAVTEQLQRVLPKARRRAEVAGLEFRYPDAPPPPRTPADRRPCRWPWTRVFISARGDVRPCPYAAGPEGLTLGTLLGPDAAPFPEIWNGEKMQTLREQIRTRHNPAFCRACYPGWNP